MSKRTPMKKGETGYAYVFLSEPGIVLKIRALVTDYKWSGKSLKLNLKSSQMYIAKYTGSRNMVYFPSVDKTRALNNFSGYFYNNFHNHLYIDVNGVDALHNPKLPEDFDSNTSTLSLLRHMRVPPPVSVHIEWTVSQWSTKTPEYACNLTCIEGARQTVYRKQTEMDRLIEELV